MRGFFTPKENTRFNQIVQVNRAAETEKNGCNQSLPSLGPIPAPWSHLFIAFSLTRTINKHQTCDCYIEPGQWHRFGIRYAPLMGSWGRRGRSWGRKSGPTGAEDEFLTKAIQTGGLSSTLAGEKWWAPRVGTAVLLLVNTTGAGGVN